MVNSVFLIRLTMSYELNNCNYAVLRQAEAKLPAVMNL